ncbi:Rop family plasmid primer RNA-binding protein [Klebsiella pneumoniae]|nr:Rop family plasmid primer RNA-binding protein [Klebsiella pneumoniae]
MNRQESAVLNMAKFIRAQTLLLLERIDLLDFDDEATDCEQLHEQAEALYRKLSARLESDRGQFGYRELLYGKPVF